MKDKIHAAYNVVTYIPRIAIATLMVLYIILSLLLLPKSPWLSLCLFSVCLLLDRQAGKLDDAQSINCC